MADPIFENQRLVDIYDAFDGDRDDLIHYLNIVTEFGASSILDIGSGTGCFSCMLAKKGFTVIGLEPAKASLDLAAKKQYADQVQWILGDTASLPTLQVDMAFMTGNVAQVFLSDKEWEQNLSHIHDALSPNGYLIFEVRDPTQKAWQNWTKGKTYKKLNIPNIGEVDGWCDVKDVSDENVTFIWRYYFHTDQTTIESESRLRFRTKESIIHSLNKTGFSVTDIRDAPDRPQQEFVFIAQKAEAST